jgi:hypothetical protein
MSDINTDRFTTELSADDLVTILKALYWHQDKLSNMERAKGRDNFELDRVLWLRSRFGKMLSKEAYLD